MIFNIKKALFEYDIKNGEIIQVENDKILEFHLGIWYNLQLCACGSYMRLWLNRIEHLTSDQRVMGSNPIGRANFELNNAFYAIIKLISCRRDQFFWL